MLQRTFSLYVNAFTGLSKATWLLSFVMLINRSGTMVIPYMAIYLTQPSMGYSIQQAGLVIGIFGVGAICGGFLGGRLTDRLGFFRVQVATLAGGGLLFILLGQMRSYPLICGCTFLLSLVNEAFRPANSTAIAHYSKEENRTRSYSLNRLAVTSGWTVGVAIGGVLASINYKLLFWVDGGTNILAAVLLRQFLSGAAAEAPVSGEKPVVKGSRSAYADKAYLLFIGFTMLLGLFFYQVFTIIPEYLKQDRGMPEYLIGLVMGLNGVVIALVEMVLVFRLEGRKHPLYFVSLGCMVMALFFVLLNLLPGMVAASVVCMLVFTVGEVLSMPFMNSFWVSRTDGANRGQYAGLWTMAWAVAQALGPSCGSQLAGHFGFRVLWWTGSICCVLSAAGFYWLQQKNIDEHA